MTLPRATLGFLTSALVALGTSAASAQTPAPSTTQLEFEVASVRLSPPNAGYTYISTTYPTNRFTAANASLPNLISLAYGVDTKNVSGGPDWLGDQLYDISAEAEGDAGLSREQMQPLLQRLLQQRLHLATHRQQKQVSGYALVVAKGGAKLSPSKGDQPVVSIFAGRIIARTVPVKTFAAVLSYPIGDPVIDKTGIQGQYDFQLEYAPADDPDSSLPSIFTALQERFGLKLEPQKVPVEMLIIDHVDRTPTEN